MTRYQKFILILPLIYSCFLSLLVFSQVTLFSGDLTPQAKELLSHSPFTFLVSTFFLLLPNFLLSFFLFSYIKANPLEEKNAFLLCIMSLIGATLLSFSIWAFYYTEFSQVPAIVFGFPVAYFFGMCIGYVIGIIVMGLKK